MNLVQLKKNVNERVQLRPIARRFDKHERELQQEDDDWIIQEVSDEGIRISNIRTGHTTVLGRDHIHHYTSNPDRSQTGVKHGFLTLNVQILLKGATLKIEPTAGPGTPLTTLPVVPTKRSVQPRANYPAFLGVSNLPSGEPRIFLREDSAEALMQTLVQIPPLSRRAVAEEAYWGRWVRWSGIVGSIREGDDCYGVTVQSDIHGRYFLTLTFPTSWRADLEVLREGDQIYFEAQILRVHELGIELVNPLVIEHFRAHSA